MIAELKGIISPDTCNLEAYLPADPGNFSLLLQVMVGLKNQDGHESFDITVCTPIWLNSILESDGAMVGQHFLFVRQYDYPLIVDKIRRFLSHCSGDCWSAVAEKVSHLGHWEFDAYVLTDEK